MGARHYEPFRLTWQNDTGEIPQSSVAERPLARFCDNRTGTFRDGTAYSNTLLFGERASHSRRGYGSPNHVFVSDELIMAFADGELDAPLARHIRQAIRDDETLRRKHEMFCSTRVVLARAFDDTLTEPVPARLKAAIKMRRRILSN